MLLNINHTTVYNYHRAVRLGPHRLMIRALEGHEVQIRQSQLMIEPVGRIRWYRDVYDNSVAIVDFAEPSARLSIRSILLVEQFNTNPFDFLLESTAEEVPFEYQGEERDDVQTFLAPHYPESQPALREWVKPFLDGSNRARTLEFFTAVNQSIHSSFRYIPREEPGVQSPMETLQRRSGSCRDWALVLMETARMMGVAARFVSGYLCRSERNRNIAETSDTTHAWAELYLPGAGWKGFDPTCGTLAGDYCVRVAVARSPGQAVPVSGSFEGAGSDYAGMDVVVETSLVSANVLNAS